MSNPLLSDLRPLQLTDLPRFKQAVIAGQQRGWNFYFPYLLFVRLGSQSARYLWEERNGSLCVFRHQYARKNRLDLAFPPFPYQESALLGALERSTDFNQSDNSRIYFIDEQDMPQLRQLNLFRLTKRNPQYLFSPKALSSLAGPQFQNLRRKISLASRRMEIDIQPYGPEYAAQCRQLLNDWERQKEKQSDSVFFQRRYALNAFHFAPQLDNRDLNGFVYLVNQQVRALTFGGEIRPNVGCLLLSIADPSNADLGYFIRQHFISTMQDYEIVNDGSDGGDHGLREMKQRFRPTGFHIAYTGKQVTRLASRATTSLSNNTGESETRSLSPDTNEARHPVSRYSQARYELRPSTMVPGQVGLFALVDFVVDEIVAPYAYFDETRLITWAEFETLDEATRYKLIQYCYKDRKGLHAPKDINSLGICYFINHSCDPNLYCNKKGDYVAQRNVKAGEELTADLEKNMKKTYTQFACCCKSANCRGIIRI
ncbi:phosphatidylglycerol lysyltransferase domain-containing protein [Halochromatium roseum]|uniref:phosphatidylglycerol lysyltransferase domain-containing protein n=1 Tax=Halochromatium roseum TaxID=391920 RepID=UPI0019134202|nr:phosphatidylglycerol lysyltransferase domain-containing protein [Halochromatium roseum]MBK5941223.1 hypothetical protein [Halochromatium roseum]